MGCHEATLDRSREGAGAIGARRPAPIRGPVSSIVLALIGMVISLPAVRQSVHAFGPAPAVAAAQEACRVSAADAAWADRALANWRVAERRFLKLEPAPLPAMVLFDARCTLTAEAGETGPVRWNGTSHGPVVRTPDGQQIPVGTVSFAAPLPSRNQGAFFVMSLPSVWRAAGVESGLGLEGLMDGVFLHELAHTRQFYFSAPMLNQLTKRHGLPDDLSDNSLQEAFARDGAYRRAYEAERDALFAAAGAATDAEARARVRRAVALRRVRYARFFTGDNLKWAPLDTLFLTLEGLGQWIAYQWATDAQGGGLEPERALAEVRRGGRFWSQDAGLAAFLVVDRLVPNWQARAFSTQPVLIDGLLDAAAH